MRLSCCSHLGAQCPWCCPYHGGCQPEDQYHSFLVPLTHNFKRVSSMISRAAQQDQTTIAHAGTLLSNWFHWPPSLSVLSPHPPTWSPLPDKLLALKSLSQHLLGKCNLSLCFWTKFRNYKTPEREDKCIHVADLLCCITETDTAVWSSYTPEKKKKTKLHSIPLNKHFEYLCTPVTPLDIRN